MAKLDTWMPMYWGDYLRDTMSLNRAEHGSYLLLIGAYWSNGGPLPDDSDSLCNIARCSSADWPRTRLVMTKFFEIKAGMWHHKRIDAELKRSQELSDARRKAGTAGNESRWGGSLTAESVGIKVDDTSQCDTPAIRKPVADVSQTGPQSQSQSQSPSDLQPDPQSQENGAVAPFRRGKETDKEWFDGLKTDAAYQGVNIEHEFAKMVRWCRENRRQPNRRRFTNWLNKCDAAIAPPVRSDKDYTKRDF